MAKKARAGAAARTQSVRRNIPLARKLGYGLLVTVVLFAGVEILLRAMGFSPDPARPDPVLDLAAAEPVFRPAAGGDGQTLTTAPRKLPYFNLQRFESQKPEGYIRVFCLGGSTTYGRPYDDTTSFTAWLREFLDIATDHRQWEVINAGGISYASYRVAAVMEELCAYAPDLFIVYTGHNEFLEERTYQQLQSIPSSVRTVNSMLQQSCTYSLVERWVSPAGRRPTHRLLLPAEVSPLLDQASGPSAYVRNDPLRARILEDFASNLVRMVELARAAGAEVIFVTPAANLKDMSPFKSEHADGLHRADRDRCERLRSTARELVSQGRLDAALDALETAGALDDRHADTHFLRGRVLFRQGRLRAAREAFLRAIDEDVCPLRAVPEMQQMVSQVAVRHGVPLVDFAAVVENDCRFHHGHDSPGKEYFLDHVHPTVLTHRLLAVALFEALVSKELATPNALWRERAVELASERIASRIDPELQARAITNLAQVLSWAGKQDEAGPLGLEAVRLRTQYGLADDAESLFYAAVHLAVTGSSERAIEGFQRVIEMEPDHFAARWRLAVLLYDQQEFELAEQHFVESIRLNPSHALSHHQLGKILRRDGRHQNALDAFQKAAELTPDDAQVCFDVARTLEELGRDQEAMFWYRETVRLDEESAGAQQRLGRLLMDQQEIQAALRHFENASQTDPHLAEIQSDLNAARQALQIARP